MKLQSIDVLCESRKKKNKKHGKYGNASKMELKTVLREKTINKCDSEEYEGILAEHIDNLRKEISKYANNNSKILQDKSDVADLFTNKKFSKAICNVMKDNEKFVPEVFYCIAELYVTKNKAFNSNEKLAKRYLKVFAALKKDEIKKLAKSAGISKDNALLLLLLSTGIKQEHLGKSRPRILTFLAVIYDNKESFGEKTVRKIFKICYGRRMRNLILTILGEKPQTGNENYSTVTNVALDYLEKMDKDDRKELLRSYAKNNKKYPNGKRRISLYGSISEEDYKGICKTVSRLIDTGFPKELFL